MVEDVGFNDTVEELPSDEAEFTVDSSGGTTSEVPGPGVVVRESGVSVLEVGDGNWKRIS